MIIRLSDAPGISKLTAAYLDRFDQVSHFFASDYREWRSFEEMAGRVDKPAGHRRELAAILREQNLSLGAGTATLDHIDLLATPGTVAVLTGQQVGLFGGPLYTIYKILTAIKLAEKLRRTFDRPYVPVFWPASEDHDFAEVDHITFIDRDNQVRRLQYNPADPPDRIPLSRVIVDEGITELLAELENATFPSDFRDDVLKALREFYKPGCSFAAAFADWIMRLCRSFGLVIADPADPRIKQLATHVFRREVEENSPSTRAVMAATEQVVASGYTPQVQLQEGILNLFLLDGRRQTLAIRNGDFVVKDSNQRLSRGDLLKLVREQPERFSANVVLRPILQDAIFPTVAYVAGPSEISYFAQFRGLYETFDVPMPIIFPRKSLTLLENKVDKVLDKYGLTLRDFWNQAEALISRIARDQLPESLQQSLESAASCIHLDLEKVESEVLRFDSSLKDLVEVTKGKVAHQLSVLEKKILQSYKKQNEIVRQQLLKAANNLYPEHNLQERVLNITPFLFKYDWALIDRLYEVMDISDTTHQVVRI